MKTSSLLVLLFLAACSGPQQNPDTPVKQNVATSPQDTSIQHRIIPAEGTAGFGYDIYVAGKLYIHQPTIPAVPGNQGFSSEEKASRAAAFVELKIRNNILPPAVSVNELDSLGVLE